VGWGGSFLMVDRNNTGRLGAGFINVCVETRWLGRLGGFYVPGYYCSDSEMLTGVMPAANSADSKNS